MRRLLSLFPLLALVLLVTACASGPRAAPAEVDPALLPVPGVALQDDGGAASESTARRREPTFGDYALVVPENLVWVPWKILAGTGKGFADGIAAGFEPHREPILSLVMTPVNAVVGLVTGLVVGTVSEPGFMGPRTNFSRTMGLPLQRPTPIWWLP